MSSADKFFNTIVDERSLGIAESIVQRQSSTHEGATVERRNSRESSEGDLVHLSELGSTNNGNSPSEGATPITSENQQVELKFERRDSQGDSSSTIVTNPHLAPKQRRDVKEPGYDEIEDTIQMTRAYMLTNEPNGKSKHQLKTIVRTATGVALTAVLIGTYIYLKYR